MDYMKYIKYVLILGFCCILVSCKDGNIAVSENSNENTSKLINETIENIDLQSYKGLENVFSNNARIESDSKPIMLVFGTNSCKYCEMLKEDIKNNHELNLNLETHFKSYYINTSYSKNHFIAYLNTTMKTDSIAHYYNLSQTPLVLWLEPNGKQILKIAGYDQKIFLAMVEFVQNKEYGNEKDPEKRREIFAKKYMQMFKS